MMTIVAQIVVEESKKNQALLITVSTKGTFGGLPFNPGSQQDTNSHKSINKTTLWSLCVYNPKKWVIIYLEVPFILHSVS